MKFIDHIIAKLADMHNAGETSPDVHAAAVEKAHATPDVLQEITPAMSEESRARVQSEAYEYAQAIVNRLNGAAANNATDKKGGDGSQGANDPASQLRRDIAADNAVTAVDAEQSKPTAEKRNDDETAAEIKEEQEKPHSQI